MRCPRRAVAGGSPGNRWRRCRWGPVANRANPTIAPSYDLAPGHKAPAAPRTSRSGIIAPGMRDEIRTDRLLLRPLCMRDAESMFAYRGDPEVARFQSWAPPSLEDVRSVIAGQRDPNPDEPGWYHTAIVELRTGILLGDIGIHILESDPRQVELGFTLAPHAQRCGHATEAVRAILHTCWYTWINTACSRRPTRATCARSRCCTASDSGRRHIASRACGSRANGRTI